MKLHLKLLCPLSIMVSCSVNAMNIIPSDSNFYYKLDGGSDLSRRPATRTHSITLGGDAKFNLSFSCKGFNPAISMRNAMNNIENSAEALKEDILQSATAAVQSFAMYALEKANPELYAFLQNAMVAASDTFRLSTKSCETALSDLRAGKSPYEDWFSISDSQGWLAQSKAAEQGQDVDINESAKEISKEPEKYGVPWVHEDQNSGGTMSSQVPIRVIYDVVVAGYNVISSPERALDDESTPAPEGSALAQYWATPTDAGKWSQMVLGDIAISAGENQSTHTGLGLIALLQLCPADASNSLTCVNPDEPDNIKSKLADVVSSAGYPSSDQIQSLNPNQILITPQLIDSLRNLNKEQQIIAVNKLAEDMATQNLVNQALILRRVLLAGAQTQPVHNLKPALEAVDKAIKTLEKDIQNVLFEQNVKKSLTTNTAKTILSLSQRQNANALTEHDATSQPLMSNGAMYQNTGE